MNYPENMYIVPQSVDIVMCWCIYMSVRLLAAHDKNHTLWNNVLILRIIHIIIKKSYTLTESLNCLQSDTYRTRRCVYTVDPPDDEHNMARNM